MRFHKHKFNAKPTEAYGIRFDSKHEAAVYHELMLAQKAGEVVMVLRQVPFHLPGGVTYRCDFQIFWKDGTVEFRDAKGYETPEFKAKKKMVEALYPVEIHLA